MAVTLPRIDYASGDFQSFLDNLQGFMQAELPTDVFNDFVASQLMMFMLRMNAYVSDIQSFKLDMVANENFLPTAFQRRSIIRFSKAVGYQIPAATAASVTVTATLAAPQASPVTFRAGTNVSAADVIFELDQDYVLPAGSLTIDMGASQGETFTQDFTSTGAINQKPELNQFPVIQNSVQVFVDDIAWTEIDFFAFAGPSDESYVLSFDENDKGIVEFGNNVFGFVPPIGSTIRVIYRVGGGTTGNITAGAVSGSITGFINNVNPFDVPVSNAAAASGGSNSQSVALSKLFIPRHLKTIDHAVTDDDYDTLSSSFSDPAAGTVAKANAALRGGELNKIDIFVWTRLPDGTLTGASLALRNALKAYIVERNVISHDVAVFSGVTEPVDITANVTYVASKTETEASDAINAALTTFFNSDELNPGNPILLSELYSIIFNLTEVQSLIMVAPAADVAIQDSRIAVLGNVTLTLTPAELGS